jgi:hypothetical protein
MRFVRRMKVFGGAPRPLYIPSEWTMDRNFGEKGCDETEWKMYPRALRKGNVDSETAFLDVNVW